MDFPYFAVFFLVFFVILAPLVLGSIIFIYKDHSKATGGVINYDSNMRKFVYKVNLSKQEIFDLLSSKNGADKLSCTFDFEKSVIRFSELGSYSDYYFQILECNGFSILRLERVSLLHMKGYIIYKLNPFMVSKLQAEIIPYSKYFF